VVTLTATPGSGYHFSDWEGACSGSGSCVVTISAAASVSAIFVANPIPPTPAPPAPPTPTPPAPPAPVVTASAPAFKHLRAPSVKVKGKKVSLDTGYELVCAGTGPDCSFSLVSSHGVIIGKLSGATASGGTTELVVQLNANGLKLLKKQESLLVTLKLSASRGTQSLSPAVVKITVKRPPRLPR
jgi:hypothetical protein